jgi:hypothetical protein
MWRHCTLYRQALASRNMSEELQTVFQAVITFINYVKNGPLRGRLYAKLCDDMEAEYTALLYYCGTRWLFCAKVLHSVLELKEKNSHFSE